MDREADLALGSDVRRDEDVDNLVRVYLFLEGETEMEWDRRE